MKKLILIFAFLFVLILIPLIDAQPPFAQDINFLEGYEIKYPANGLLKANESYTFFFHVFNISNGLPVGVNDVNCSFHFYNETGQHTINESNILNDGEHDVINEWEIIVDGGNFSRVGDYSYIIQCNSTNFGGFESVGIVVTESGFDINEGNSTIIYTIILFLMVLAGLFIYAFFKSEGKFQVKWVFFIVGYIFFLSALSLSILALRDSLVNPSIISFLDSFMAISFILFWFAFGLLAVMWFLTMLQTILFNKKKGDLEKYG